MKRYNKFYNISLGNFLKVACCSLSIITIASCAEEPFEQESNSESELLLETANALRIELGNSSYSGLSSADLDNIQNLKPNSEEARQLCKKLEKAKDNQGVTRKLKTLFTDLCSKCKSFFGFEKEENKPTDDNPSQAEPKLNIAEEWKKIENNVKQLITQYERLGKGDDLICHPLTSILYLGTGLDDAEVVCSQLKKWGKDFISDKGDFQGNQDVLDLFDQVASEIDAFIEKFDKSEQAVGGPSPKEQKLNKTEEWKKVEEAAQKLINKANSRGVVNDNVWAPLKSILDAGQRLCANDSYSNLINDLQGLKGFKFGEEDRREFKYHAPEVIELMNKVESGISAFIDKFYKSEAAVDINVSK